MLAPPPLLLEKLLEVDAAEELPYHLVTQWVKEDTRWEAVKHLHADCISSPVGEIVGEASWMLQ